MKVTFSELKFACDCNPVGRQVRPEIRIDPVERRITHIGIRCVGCNTETMHAAENVPMEFFVQSIDQVLEPFRDKK